MLDHSSLSEILRFFLILAEMVLFFSPLRLLNRPGAVTVHKSQGSEYPVVIFPLFMQHYVLLSRNLVYTGLTRAKQLAILVGPTKAIGFSIKRVMDRQRYTALAERLKRWDPSMQ